MCEIQFVLGKKELTVDEKEMFFKMMENGSVNNSDAWGVYYKDTLVKEYGKPDNTTFNSIKENIMESDVYWVMGHNRLSTSGKNGNHNNHPFETNNFVVVHNGVLYNNETLKREEKLNYEETVDSYIIPALLEKYNGIMNEQELIKFVAEQISGSYSVLIFSKVSGLFYYFKNDMTDISIIKINNTIFISTKKNSINPYFVDEVFLPSMQEGFLSSGVIYRIDQKTNIKALTPFKEKEQTIYNYGYSGYGRMSRIQHKKVDNADILKEYIEKTWCKVASIERNGDSVNVFILKESIYDKDLDEFVNDCEMNCPVYCKSYETKRKTYVFNFVTDLTNWNDVDRYSDPAYLTNPNDYYYDDDDRYYQSYSGKHYTMRDPNGEVINNKRGLEQLFIGR